MQSRKFSIGIDIGGTNTAFGIVNRKGEVMYQSLIATDKHHHPQTLLQAVAQELAPSIEELGRAEFVGLGIGAPGANYYTGIVSAAANLNWEQPVSLKELAQEVFQLPCTITNDAKAAAIGEMTYGAAKGMKDFILITLGTGMGSGFVANGQLIYGHDGFAGELGHTIAIPNGRACGCGRKGCLERYVSASGIVATATTLLEQQKNEPSEKTSLLAQHLSRQGSFSTHDIFLAATQSDPIALQTFESTGKILGLALANAVAVTGPQAIILFGGPTRAGKLLFDPLQLHFEENLLSLYQDKVALLSSLLPESDAAILGASALAW